MYNDVPVMTLYVAKSPAKELKNSADNASPTEAINKPAICVGRIPYTFTGALANRTGNIGDIIRYSAYINL